MLSRSPKRPELPMKVVPLTSLKGFEIGPSFSRDGTRVAFAWNGEAQDNFDIYVQLVGSRRTAQRLTTEPAFEVNPVWSPDDMQIAYLRRDPQRKELNVWVMSALGGPGHKVSDLPVSFGISWSPDGRYINAARLSPKNGIYRIPVQGGEPVASLRPTAAERGWRYLRFHRMAVFSRMHRVKSRAGASCRSWKSTRHSRLTVHLDSSPGTPRSESTASPGVVMGSSSSTLPPLGAQNLAVARRGRWPAPGRADRNRGPQCQRPYNHRLR